jgi:hypothetical protein
MCVFQGFTTGFGWGGWLSIIRRGERRRKKEDGDDKDEGGIP